MTHFSPSGRLLTGPVDPSVENPGKNTVDQCMFLIADCLAYLPLILFLLLFCIYHID